MSIAAFTQGYHFQFNSQFNSTSWISRQLIYRPIFVFLSVQREANIVEWVCGTLAVTQCSPKIIEKLQILLNLLADTLEGGILNGILAHGKKVAVIRKKALIIIF